MGFLFRQMTGFPASPGCLAAIALISFFMTLQACSTMCAASDSAAVMKNATDHLSLLAFKKEVTLDPANVLSSWNASFHFCFWRGVTCGRKHQRVTVLRLPSSGIAGTLTPHLGNLTFLRGIHLENNSFHGEIPQEVGRLFRLRHLVLMNNSFEGGIPNNLSNCPHLITINVANNKLHGTIPAELGSLQSLDYLNLQFNRISGVIPPTLGNLSSLTHLALVECNLEGPIPHQLGQLSKLEYFGIFENQLTGEVPLSIYNNLSNIISFQIEANNLTGNLPSHVGDAFPRLEFFSVALNRLTGTIPRSLFNASHLGTVDVGDNNFVGSIPAEIGKLGISLSRFHAGDNQLGGDLQFITSLTNCTNLYGFAADNNNLHGLLPNSFRNLSANTLEVIILGRNRIYGTIHPELGKLYNLRQLVLADNLLKGSLPPSIGKITNLEALSLENNRFAGRIPRSLANLTLLVELNLATNLLQGNIQQILAVCANLDSLILSDNQLEGSIPPILAKCANLRTLYLDNNRLTGTIPSDLFGLSSLVDLNLSDNSLKGDLPQEIGTLINVKTVSVGKNNLSGSIPAQIGNCLALEVLLMDGNALEGAIPLSLSELRALRVVDLSRNKLEGLLPRNFAQLKRLEYLNLSYNDLKGEVPREGIFKNVTAVSLQGNSELCGGISELHLPSCTNGAGHGKHKRATMVKVVLLAVGGSILVLVIVALCLILFFRKQSLKNKTLSPRLSFNDMKVISYRNLLNATNCFSPSNLIGTGSFGFVYKGVLSDDDQTVVAVKVFNLEQVGASESFMSECEALQNIRHRNLVKILTCCSGQDYRGNEFKALVYEFMGNGTLESWLHPGNGPSNGHSRLLSLRARLEVAIDVANALDYLHNHCDNPIVHCDLKPANILFDEDMVAHVTDFGLARILLTTYDDSSSQLVCTDKLKGTAGYIPPEYGTNSHVTTQGDVFSYGILLLEMLVGKKPTHEMFKDGLTISNYAKTAFPSQVMDIVDPVLFPRLALGQDVLRRIGDCIISILKIGIECSSNIPSNRTDMGIVKNKLERVREQLPRGHDL